MSHFDISTYAPSVVASDDQGIKTVEVTINDGSELSGTQFSVDRDTGLCVDPSHHQHFVELIRLCQRSYNDHAKTKSIPGPRNPDAGLVAQVQVAILEKIAQNQGLTPHWLSKSSRQASKHLWGLVHAWNSASDLGEGLERRDLYNRMEDIIKRESDEKSADQIIQALMKNRGPRKYELEPESAWDLSLQEPLKRAVGQTY